MPDGNGFIVSLLITVVSFLLGYFVTKKPRLRFYYGAITQIPVPNSINSNVSDAGLTESVVRTHTIVISNQGNLTATNVRVGHNFLPLSHSVSPKLNIQNPENPNEILIPALVPGAVFTVSYLYLVDKHFSEINTYLICDQGMGEVATLQNVTIKSPLLIWLMRGVFFIGILSIVYFGIKFATFIYKLYSLANP